MQQRTNGFILPSTILLSLAIAIITATFMQYVANSSQALNKQTYTSIAQEAADAGVSYAISCVKQSVDPSTWTSLAPNTDCFGRTQSNLSSNVMTATDGQWQSSFSVAPATVISTSPEEQQVTATGTVQFFANGFQVGTVTVSRNVTLASSLNSVAVSTGNSLTALASDTHSCAIANGQLYCWGDNQAGQLGLGDTTDRSVPTPVATGAGQAFYGKMVTKMAVGTTNTCAVADGQLYCWGDNTNGQLGLGNNTNSSANYSPQLVAATLPTDAFYGKKITNIAVSKSTYTNKAACAVANGIPYCWGANTTQQLGQSTSSVANTTAVYSPVRVYGYNSGNTASVLYGKKTQSITIGSNDACSSTTGTIYCWGVSSGSTASPPAALTVGNSDIIEPLSLKNIGSVRTCGIGAGQLTCRNTGDNSFGIAYGAEPQNQSSGTVDSFDGAQNTAPGPGAPYSGQATDNGGSSYCVVDVIYLALRCGGTGLYSDPQSNDNTSTAARSGSIVSVGGLTGSRYACAVVNGGLACWGTETQGQLADNTPSGTSKYVKYATFSTATPGFGTDNVNYNSGYYPFKVAAGGSISAGANHECAVVAARAVCWGDNSKGQIGTGDVVTQTQPTIITVETISPNCFGVWVFGGCFGIPLPSRESPVELVAAGGNHSCAIVDTLHSSFNDPVPVSSLYCWGSNASGELGTGNTTEYHTAKRIRTSNNRMTAVSAGAKNSCVIDNFQLWCWGDNTYGQLGNIGKTSSSTPVQITSGGLSAAQVTAVSVGATHICAVANGNGYCWGDNTYGQLGTGSATATPPVTATNYTPQLISTGVAGATDGNITATFTAIAAGNGYTCAVINGTTACWGRNDMGQTGTGNVVSPLLTPTTVAGAAGSMQGDALAAGDSHACAVLQARVYCWGNNANGRVGNSIITGVTSTPYLVNSGGMSASPPLGATLNASINVAAGGSSTSGGTSCSVTNADIVCWGAGTSGQIGIAGTSDVGTPATIPLYRSVGSSTIGPIY